MSIEINEEIKRWTARRKSALVLEIIQGKSTVSESSRKLDLSPSEIESWIDQARPRMQNALKDKPEDIREQYGTQLKTLQDAYGKAMLELRIRKNGKPCWRRRTRHDPSYLAGHKGRRIYHSDGQALSLVRGSSTHRVLQAGQAGTEGSRALRLADRATDRDESSFCYRNDIDVWLHGKSERNFRLAPVRFVSGVTEPGQAPGAYA
jgi:transposase-like protein